MSKNHENQTSNEKENEKVKDPFEQFPTWRRGICHYMAERRFPEDLIKKVASNNKIDELNREQIDAICDIGEYIKKDKEVFNIIERVLSLNLPVDIVRKIRDHLFEMPEKFVEKSDFVNIVMKSLQIFGIDPELRIDIMRASEKARLQGVPKYMYEEFLNAKSKKALVLMYTAVIKYDMPHYILHVCAAHSFSWDQEKVLNKELTKLMGKTMLRRNFEI